MDTIGERLREERERLDFNQVAFGAIGGVAKRAQIHYEQNERSPDAKYLAAVAKVGVDVRYVITGERKGPVPVKLTEEEAAMLTYWREATKPVRRAALGALIGASPQNVEAAPTVHQEIRGNVHGGVAAGDIVNRRNTREK
jgi:transcriptional regulator with XRE-family HTH domain